MQRGFTYLLIALVGLSFTYDDIPNYSLYFDLTKQPELKELDFFDTDKFSTYALVENENNALRSAAGDELIIDYTGMYIAKNKVLSISKTEIRENSQYTVKDGYLFGVLENDSLMVALEGETYYFLMPSSTYLFQTNQPDNRLFKGLSPNSYFIFSKESNGYFSVIEAKFSAGMISLSELDFDQRQFDFRTVRNSTSGSSDDLIYYLNPTKEEWTKIASHFKVYDQYSKQP